MRKIFWLAPLCVLLASGGVASAAVRPAAQSLNLPAGSFALADDGDDEKPEVTARVARISFIKGDVKIKRIGNDEWEKAVLNLPLIEGDEIVTGPDARLELQFNNYAHARLDHDGSLKISVMKDEGIALGLVQGTLNVRVTDLKKSGGYFEIDAPRTTIAVEAAGTYRLDAADDSALHVSVNEGGAARIYSENAGFTLKSGRGATVFIAGERSGEWETETAKVGDDFDAWTNDRDDAIAKRLAAAYYDKYYDQDIYGAEDLNDNGEWIYTSSYGYVWRPYSAALSGYADWSPYRYGHWRWVGAFGWTWVNDEPWGWATYHHGRWVYDHGYWVWCPYGYYRPRHSWWFPAVVSINIVNNNVCWYPLGYRHRWHDYNHNGNGGNPNNDNRLRTGMKMGGTVTANPIRETMPTSGVVGVPISEFGTRKGGVRAVPAALATAVLAKEDQGDTTVLPNGREIGRSGRSEIAASRPVTARPVPVKIGAAERTDARPLDNQLRETRILGGRGLRVQPDGNGASTSKDTAPTGAVVRPAPERRPVNRSSERVDTMPIERHALPQQDPGARDDSGNSERKPAERETRPRGTRQIDPPARIEPRQERPKPETPRQEPPARSEPKREARPVEKPAAAPRRESPKEGI